MLIFCHSAHVVLALYPMVMDATKMFNHSIWFASFWLCSFATSLVLSATLNSPYYLQFEGIRKHVFMAWMPSCWDRCCINIILSVVITTGSSPLVCPLNLIFFLHALFCHGSPSAAILMIWQYMLAGIGSCLIVWDCIELAACWRGWVLDFGCIMWWACCVSL